MTDFPKILKQLRLSKNISQKTIASEFKIAERQYRRYENGEIDTPLTFACYVADYFDVSLDYLVGRSSDSNRH